MTSVYGDLNGKISSIISPTDPLCNYYIKSAYNCCNPNNYRNDYVDICSLKNILKQGVRGLDLEVFSIDDMPVVASSTDSSSKYVKETFNHVPMSDVLKTIKQYAFASSTAPNSSDPIFLLCRIKSTNQKMYKHFAKLLEQYNALLLGKEYSFGNGGKNLGEVPLSALLGKIVLIVDKSDQNSFEDCAEFHEYVNGVSNSLHMRVLRYNDIQHNPDMSELTEFNRLGMTIGIPDLGYNPENPSGVVMRECGVQFIGMRYSANAIDANVGESDAFFNADGHAFVLKPEHLRYVPIMIDAPAPQNPDLSYAPRTISSNYYQFQI